VYVRADGAQLLQPAARFAAEALTIDIGPHTSWLARRTRWNS
jgi:hypothetical protein